MSKTLRELEEKEELIIDIQSLREYKPYIDKLNQLEMSFIMDSSLMDIDIVRRVFQYIRNNI